MELKNQIRLAMVLDFFPLNASRGAVFSIPQLWELSQRWYHNRLSPEFRGRTLEQVQELFREAGLTSDFWQAA